MARKIIIDDIPEFTYQRLLKQKSADGFADKSWKEWVFAKASPSLQVTDAEGIRQSTRHGLRQLWGRNMGHNIAYLRRRDMKSLRDMEPTAKPVLVVGGGPSIEQHNQLETLASSNRENLTVVTCDKMLIPLLAHGIVPDYVLSVDGSDIILKFFKSKLFLRHKDRIKMLLHIAVNPKVVRYLYRHGAQVYWFLAHQVYVSEEEVEQSDAIVTICMTSTPHHPKGIQTLVAAGNVGVAAWAFAVIILKTHNVALIGFDMGYPEGTPLNKTYYYSTFLNMTQARFGANAYASLTAEVPYENEYNPAWGTHTKTDQVFRSYRAMFYDLLSIAPKETEIWSCVEGGTLYHPRLKYATLQSWLNNLESR
jgi:hypothetical protein